MHNGIDEQSHPQDSPQYASRATVPLQRPSEAIDPTISSALHELIDLSAFALTILVHPVDSFRTHAYYINPFGMFGGKSFTPAQIQDLSGKTVLVTGGNGALGKETVLQLAKHNPSRIYLAARTEAKAKDAISSIQAQVPKANVHFLPLDLASFDSIRDAAAAFKSESSRLDLLFLNAGIMAVPPGKTASGHEIQLGTNHLGHFLLTKELLPILLSTAELSNADVRVITLSSEAFSMSPKLDTLLSTEQLSATGTWGRYGGSKLANILFAAELARRYPKLTSVSLHPGLIKTDLWTPTMKMNPIVRYGLAVFGPLVMENPAKGAFNQLWAAVGAKKEDLTNGAYYTPVGRLGSGNAHAKNESEGKTLWDWSEEELAKSGF